MYRSRLKAKALLLLCMLIFLVFLAVKDQNKKGESKENILGSEGEMLVIPETEEETTTEDNGLKEWISPGQDAKIRVLLLDASGSIFHKEKETKEEYPGKIDYYEEPEGWVIVNELPLEEYLRYVVPSEMPSRYAMEALKAQAVCARTYAVWQMQEYAYPEYEAHVDDSTSYQVYHQIDCQDSTDQAVEETKGQILIYEDRPVKAYYFATSCGVTTDEAIWEKGDPEQTPYLKSRFVNEEGSEKDLTDEETFDSFIKSKRAGDLEISEPWYRWTCEISLAQIRKNVERWVQLHSDKMEGLREIGEIEDVEVLSRNTGGTVQELLVTGKEGTLNIQYEYNIRQILGPSGGVIHKNDGTITKGGDLLPSGYFALDSLENDGKLIGYIITGGGLGHGAGMSQNGARILAEQGYDYLSILDYFYDGTELTVLK